MSLGQIITDRVVLKTTLLYLTVMTLSLFEKGQTLSKQLASLNVFQ